MRQVTSVPLPSSLSIETVPRCRMTKLSTIDRPRPAPPCCAVAFEAVEDRVEHILRNARTIVGNAENKVAVFTAAFQADRAAIGREIGCIGQKLDQDLLQPLMICNEEAEHVGRVDLQGDGAFLQPVRHLQRHFVEEVGQVDL